MREITGKICCSLCCIIACFFVKDVVAQSATTKTVVPGPEYSRSKIYQLLWGRHYRKEWTTPVSAPLFHLDTAFGGLKPYAAGGGRQSKTLRLTDMRNREYVLRSINKSFGKALDPIFQGTFVERLMNDQVSIAHPFAAQTVPGMAETAGIFHTRPRLVYLPAQQALDSFDQAFANDLYWIEQRPDENWEDADNFGNAKNIISTENLIGKLLSNNKNKVDQELYVRSRLFDMFIGDWGRHEDQWRWGKFEQEEETIYRPIPRDRDQTYTLFDGILLKLVKSVAGLNHLQSFAHEIKDVTTYNFPARNLDRFMANAVTRAQWQSIALSLQTALSDTVIENALRQMPAEVFPISGRELIEKLKSRRAQLPGYAMDYYNFLAKEVQITGSEKREYFEVKDSGQLLAVNIYDLKDGEKDRQLYSRVFSPEETKEILIFGIEGKDRWQVETAQKKIRLTLVGGSGKDSFDLISGRRVKVYDNHQQDTEGSGVKLHLTSDSSLPSFRYDAFRYDKKGLSPTVMYNRDDRIFVGLSYKTLQHKWRRSIPAHKHELYVRYSLMQTAPHIGYGGLVNDVFGVGWNLLLHADYDWERWTNFYGIGNSSTELTPDRDFYRVRSKEANAGLGLQKLLGKQSSAILTPFYQQVQLVNDPERYLTKNFLNGNLKNVFEQKHFAGLRLQLSLRRLDHPLLPHKGYNFEGVAGYTKNLQADSNVKTFGGDLQLYLPLGKRFVFLTENGATTVSGQPEFYQLANLGGRSLRGFRRERFWGESVFHSNNEVQYLFPFRSRLFNGTMGLVAFYDQGKVFGKNETYNKWQTTFGGGIIMTPFNKIYLSLLYGVNNDPFSKGNIRVDFRRNLW